MARATIIKFQDGSNSTLFYSHEVYKVSMFENQKVKITRLTNRKPILYYNGTAHWTGSILIRSDWENHAKIETIKGYGVCSFILYNRAGTIMENMTIKINPNIALPYAEGNIDAEKSIKISFIESTSGRTAPLI